MFIIPINRKQKPRNIAAFVSYCFLGGIKAILISALLSAIGLFGIGAAITLFTGKSVWYSGFRQVIFGLFAAAITFGIGKAIGGVLVG
ncbi:MAG: VIT1/CCC1 transporter family protein [Chitinophagaceae bacterium]|nr:VIT1/CCC1 transporter family protein [Chitinophagaceae bacterium]